MITRIWHGWTSVTNADAFEKLLRTEIFPGIAAIRVPGLLGADLLRCDGPDQVEFVTLLWFESVDAVHAFSGPDLDVAVIPPAASELLSHYNARSAHYNVIERRA